MGGLAVGLTEVPLEDPPADLTGFPARTVGAGSGGKDLYRIYRHRDPDGSRTRSPFFFASAEPEDPGGSRYDLPAPAGACYLADAPVGAWLEVFRRVGTVALEDVQARRLLTTRPPRPLRAADVASRSARRFAVTAEISTTGDYGRTRRWAAALRRAGFRAVWGLARHDPSGRARSLALLDSGGEHPPFGWRWRQDVTRVDEHRALMRAVARLGFRVVEVPNDVDTD